MTTPASPVLLETERLTLSLPPASEAERILGYYQNNIHHLSQWEPPHPKGFLTRKYWEERLALNRDEYARGMSMRLALQDRLDPHRAVIGVANYSQFVRGGFQACFLGYSIAEDRQGEGLMHEALRASIDYVFGPLQLHRIMANYIPGNRRSAAVLRRLGFQIEGYAPDYLYIGGRWRDHVLTALVNPDAPDPS